MAGIGSPGGGFPAAKRNWGDSEVSQHRLEDVKEEVTMFCAGFCKVWYEAKYPDGYLSRNVNFLSLLSKSSPHFLSLEVVGG